MADHHEVIHPPVLLVLTAAGPRGLRQKLRRVADLSGECWQSRQGGWRGYRSYDDTIPVLAGNPAKSIRGVADDPDIAKVRAIETEQGIE